MATIKRSDARPELVGGVVEIGRTQVTIRYQRDGKPHQIVFAPDAKR